MIFNLGIKIKVLTLNTLIPGRLDCDAKDLADCSEGVCRLRVVVLSLSERGRRLDENDMDTTNLCYLDTKRSWINIL